MNKRSLSVISLISLFYVSLKLPCCWCWRWTNVPFLTKNAIRIPLLLFRYQMATTEWSVQSLTHIPDCWLLNAPSGCLQRATTELLVWTRAWSENIAEECVSSGHGSSGFGSHSPCFRWSPYVRTLYELSSLVVTEVRRTSSILHPTATVVPFTHLPVLGFPRVGWGQLLPRWCRPQFPTWIRFNQSKKIEKIGREIY